MVKKLNPFDMAIIKEGKIVQRKGNTHFKSLIKYIDDKKSFFIFSDNDTLNGLYILRIQKAF